MNKVIISIRRHAKTDKTGTEPYSEDRIVTEEGRIKTYHLGDSLRDENIIYGYTAPHLRSQQTLVYLMDGTRQLDLEKIGVETSLCEPRISPEFRKIINGNTQKRNERIAFFLENIDPTGLSTTPYQAACETSYFIAKTSSIHNDNLGRVEAITNAPKLECFLQTFYENAFAEFLEENSFDYLEGIELRLHTDLYIITFREKEIQIPKSKIVELANNYSDN